MQSTESVSPGDAGEQVTLIKKAKIEFESSSCWSLSRVNCRSVSEFGF